MKAALIREPGHTPVLAEIAAPVPASDEVRVAVTAAAMSPLVKGRAAGTHYSASGRFPLVPGIDGVGLLDGSTRVYFILPRAPHGSMAEETVVPRGQYVVLPDDVDDVTAAAIANPGMSSWAALTERAQLQSGETVLVNGATGTAGRLAVQIAKHLGARKVIATGRNRDALREVAALGADVTIPLVDGDMEPAFQEQFTEGVGIVLDYLWGPSAEQLLVAAAKSGADAVPIRFVQIGASGGSNITLPGDILRSSAILLMGSGIGSVSLAGLLNAIAGVFSATAVKHLAVAATPVPLSAVEQAWPRDDSKRRTVFVMSPT